MTQNAFQFFQRHGTEGGDAVSRNTRAHELVGAEASAAAHGIKFMWALDPDWVEKSPHHIYTCRASLDLDLIHKRDGIDLGPDGDPRTDPRARVIEAEIALECVSLFTRQAAA